MANNSIKATRRQALGSIAAASAAVSFPSTAAARSVNVSRSQWEAGLAQLEEARRQMEAFEPYHSRVDAIYSRLVAKVAHPFPEMEGNQFLERFSRNSARHAVERVKYVEPCAYKDHRADIEAHDKWSEYDAKIERIGKRLRRDEVEAEMDRRVKAFTDAERNLMNIPAPDAEAMMWKAEKVFLGDDNSMWSADFRQQAEADLIRFVKGCK